MHVLILGASARAAAYSARRAGLRPTCIDLFADADLTALCPARRIDPEDYPRGLAALAEDERPGPWIYTGALENNASLIEAIAARRPLWGNRAPVLRAVRDPFVWTAAVRHAGLPCPEVRSRPEGLPAAKDWLIKPLASAGGYGVVPYTPGTAIPDRTVYYQERIAGASLSAIFIGQEDRAPLAGITRQIVGRPGAEFAYMGSVGPWPITPEASARVAALGDVLAGSFGLRGLFGVDFILRDGLPWPLEINPRYTASVEVLELALGLSLLSAHRAVFDPTAPRASTLAPCQSRRAVGKLILFAPEGCSFPQASRRRPVGSDVFKVVTLGDRPQPGLRFERGEPVATLFEQADSPDACLTRLERRRDRWERRLRAGAR